jgi:pimeloyl-ACP methyl ester carboxylesterase
MNDASPDPRLQAPLRSGEEAPAWFRQVLADAPERSFVEVEGARIETLAWGERGRPGLLFLHGHGAHADWWSFIAPFFARDFRVAALSWSGMGGSDWRPSYSLDGCLGEALAVAEHAGLFDGDIRPVIIGHSFGGYATIAAAARHGERLGGAVVIDTPIFSPERRQERRQAEGPRREPRSHRIYPTLDAALERFRLVPDQPCENWFIVDHIARSSLKQVANAGEEGWTWKFDPFFWPRYRAEDPMQDLASPRCPLAVVLGARSTLMRPDDIARLRAALPETSPMIEVPEAHHHVMADQPLALVAALRALVSVWSAASGANKPTNKGRA